MFCHFHGRTVTVVEIPEETGVPLYEDSGTVGDRAIEVLARGYQTVTASAVIEGPATYVASRVAIPSYLDS